MAAIVYRVELLVADAPDFVTPEGQRAYGRFEQESDKLLKAAMDETRKLLRREAPKRPGSRRLANSLRVSKIRRKRKRGLPVVVGYQVSSGRSRRVFYASITETRQGTRVSGWFSDFLETLEKSPELENLQREIVALFTQAIAIEFRFRSRKDMIGRIKVDFPKARVVPLGRDGFRATVNFGRG